MRGIGGELSAEPRQYRVLSIRKASFIDKHAVTSLQVTVDFGNLCEVVKLVDFWNAKWTCGRDGRGP